MHVHFPFMLDGRGRVADAPHDDHVRQLIEQVLRELFGPGNEEERIATRFLVQQALITWLGELIEVKSVELIHRGERLEVVVEYTDVETRRQHAATYEVSAT